MSRQSFALKAGERSLNAAGRIGAVSNDRYVPLYPVHNLKPSPDNPRRSGIDALQLTDELVASLARKGDEPIEDWISRMEAHAASVANEAQGVSWDRLIALAGSIATSGLVQAIVALPDGTIIAGERRWLASRLAGLSTIPVNLRSIADDEAKVDVYRLVENLMRSGLTPAQTIIGVRKAADAGLGGCGMHNDRLTTSNMTSLFGVGPTTAASYVAFARLNPGDPLLTQFENNAGLTLKEAYALASARLRALRDAADAAALEATGLAVPAKKQRSTAKAAQKTVSVRIPTTDNARIFLLRLAQAGITSEHASQQLDDLADRWAELSNKDRSAQLTTVLSEIIDNLSE